MRPTLWKRFSYAVCLTVLAAFAAVAYTTTVHARDIRIVQLRDDCDPATFNAAVPTPPDAPPGTPPTCVGDGDTLFADFLDEVFATGAAEKWRFNPDNSEADQGVQARNRGGETHSFTEVKQFGGGFIEVLNLGADPLTECAARDANGKLIRDADGNLVPGAAAIASFVPAGMSADPISLAKGTHKFQCCIHPWMRSTIKVR